MAGATILQEDGVWLMQIAGECDTPACAWPLLPLTLFGPSGRTERSARGLAMWRRSWGVTHITVRRDHDVLVMDSFDITPGKYARRHRQHRLVGESTVRFASAESLGSLSPLQRSIAGAYLREFGEPVGQPAIYDNPTN